MTTRTTTPVLEIATFTVRPGVQPEFERCLSEAISKIEAATGCLSANAYRSIEHDGIYRLLVRWQNLEDHTVRFQHSVDFHAMRHTLGNLLAEPPAVEHHRALPHRTGITGPRTGDDHETR
ncbi:hypothetical protein WL74_29380 [Burkholderia cepacia]|uniref:antibiotic biosynthesis monooxygenase family protein n=1 Tax=Burkholderia cepacia TaxID=292 RepID=UPI00076CD38B|nr:antibiotic biosynthesis monooxygenase family protein [Burkholderia cepacia]KWE18347.1 hypothetical protein WL74_29380 [Burkholderia cepacia]